MVAKIAGLGVAHIVNLQPDQLSTMTQGPGNIVYMPPEAMGEHAKYNCSLDIFSFGNVALFTLTQEFVGPKLKAATYTDSTGKLKPRTEIERREYGFHILHHDLGEESPLSKLTRACLQNHPTDRPSAAELVERIKIISSDMILPSKLELIKQLSSKEVEIKEIADQIKLLMNENEQLQDMMSSHQLTLQKQSSIQQKEMADQIKLLMNENDQLQDMMSSHQLTLQKQSLIQQKEIESKDMQLKELQKVVHTKKEQIQGIEKRLVDMLAQVNPFYVISYHHFCKPSRAF
jgi:serine/threonine protein kinase